MSNQYFGRGGGGGGGYNNPPMGRGRGIGGGYPPMGHPGGHMGGGGGMMMGDRMMRGDSGMGPGQGFGRGYDMGGVNQQMNMQFRGGGGGGMPPGGGGRGIPSGGIPPSHMNMMDDRRARDRSPPPSKAVPNSGGSPNNANSAGGAVRYANDCEIIVTAKPQQQYAEMIEKEIRDCNLNVDLMFPKPDVKLSQFIDNIASMGTIFAVVIRPDNENHRSVSVHVLRGTPKPEEHRNMPLSAAYQLIKDRYYEMKKKEVGLVPEHIKKMAKCILEERSLSDNDYATLIRFFQERRRKQNAFEKRTSNVVGAENLNELIETPDALEIQQRILAIMAGEEDSKPNVEGERIGELLVPRPKQPLEDPTVANAINTLMNTSFLSNVSNLTNQGQGVPPMGRGGGGGYGRGQGYTQGF